MSKVYPQDTSQKRSERKSFKIFVSHLDSNCWDLLGSDRNDHGVDYSYEYIEDGEYKGYRILCQLKGRTSPEIKENKIVFDFPVKTANFAVGCSQPFILILVDLSTSEAYFLPIQDYFIENPKKLKTLEKNSDTIRVFIPLENTLVNPKLIQVAKSQYTFDEEKGLRKTR